MEIRPVEGENLLDTALALPALVAPLPLFWTEGTSASALAFYEEAASKTARTESRETLLARYQELHAG